MCLDRPEIGRAKAQTSARHYLVSWPRISPPPGDTVAFYFAGHGVEFGGRTYLLPSDVPNIKPGRDELLRREALSLQEFLADLRERGTRLNLVILDACRDNPFEQMAGRSVGARRGLAVTEPPEGTFIMYSAGTGESALDRLNDADRDPNSVYTRNLLPLLKAPGLSLTDVAEQVRVTVRQMAATVQHRQTPAYYNQLLGRVCIAGGVCDPLAGGPTVRQSEAAEAWAAAKETDSTAVLEAFIARYKETFQAELARARIDELKKHRVSIAPPPSKVSPSLPCIGVETIVGSEKRCLRPKDSFKDCTDCPEMVVVPTGSFMMGSPPTEKGRDSSEGPQHKVTIARPFAVGKYEVTFAEWDACWVAGDCKRRPIDEGCGRGKRPVIDVSWDAVTTEYLPWLTRKTGKGYRLLTEAEWEYAARAGTTTTYHFGNDDTALCNYANAADLSAKEKHKDAANANCRDGYVNTAPVGSFRANAFGLYDMHGNVWEWTQDCWNATYSYAPTDGSAWTTEGPCLHVLRGGSWSNGPADLRSAVRFGVPLHSDEVSVVGFRLALTLD